MSHWRKHYDSIRREESSNPFAYRDFIFAIICIQVLLAVGSVISWLFLESRVYHVPYGAIGACLAIPLLLNLWLRESREIKKRELDKIVDKNSSDNP